MPALKPHDVMPSVAARIPEYVIEVFNELIRKNFIGSQAVVMLEDAKDEVAKAVHRQNTDIPYLDLDAARKFADDQQYFEVEPIFRDAGWNVEFNKKHRGDNFESHYIFSMKH